jgi:hypothetical protein
MSVEIDKYEELLINLNITNSSSYHELFFEYEFWQKLLFASFIFPVTLFTIIGNIFLLIAIIKNKNLHIAGNIFIGSMAFADALNGLIVMPLNALQIFSG